MSQQVTINYEGVTIKCKAQCDTAIHSLCRIDKVIDKIHKSASNLETAKIKEYEENLLNNKTKIVNQINNFKKVLKQYQDMRSYSVVNHSNEYSSFLKQKNMLIDETNNLTKLVNEITGSKLAAIEEMINQELLNSGLRSAERLFRKANGIVELPHNLLEKINDIEDVSLRQLVYQEAVKEENKNLSFEKLVTKGQESFDKLVNNKYDEVISEYKDELKDNGISEDILDNVNSIDEANVIVNDAIVSEKVRKETLKIIIKAIKDRGFIVDTKNNLKIDKAKNIVKLVALKASGQIAEFEIQLNGKFMYHFDKYEGQACKKDITPFIEDLKNIYDIDIKHESITWSNPDKIQVKKYQYINQNKGTK